MNVATLHQLIQRLAPAYAEALPPGTARMNVLDIDVGGGQAAEDADFPEPQRLTIRCAAVPEDIDGDDLSRCEDALERALDLAECLIQVGPSPAGSGLPAQSATWASAVVRRACWLKRHLSLANPWQASLFDGVLLKPENGGVSVVSDTARINLIGEQGLQLIRSYFADEVAHGLIFRLVKASSTSLPSAQDLFQQACDTVRGLPSAAPATAGKQPRKRPGDSSRKSSKCRTRSLPGTLWGRIQENLTVVPIGTLTPDSGLSLFEGSVFDFESRFTNNHERWLFKFAVSDNTGSISCHMFVKREDQAALEEALDGRSLRIAANVHFDGVYAKDLQAGVIGLMPAADRPRRSDDATEKRVELHAHTKMSAKDALSGAADLISLAAEFGHPAVAVTDHGVVQAFPDAAAARDALRKREQDIQVIFGLEGYLVDDGPCMVFNAAGATLDDGFVALDTETTGLDPVRDRLIELAAVRYRPDPEQGFVPAERLVTLIDPGIPIPEQARQLTGIDDAMVAGAPEAWAVLRQLDEWVGTLPVVGHNVLFDLGFIRQAGFRRPDGALAIKFNPTLIDTLAMARHYLPDLPGYRLGSVAEAIGYEAQAWHRAEADCRASAAVFIDLWRRADVSSLAELNERAGWLSHERVVAEKRPLHHIILLAESELGLYHLYRLVSLAHCENFHGRPRIPRSALKYFRGGLVLGAACERGEVFQAVLAHYRSFANDYSRAAAAISTGRTARIARMYDYLEIQPIGNNAFYLRDPESGLTSEDDLRNLNRLVVDLGRAVGKPVCATADSHYQEPDQLEMRRILLSDTFDDVEQLPPLHFRTTGEMLEEFAYLGTEEARRVVVENPRQIAARLDRDLRPFPQGSYPPDIPEAAEEVRTLTLRKAEELYARDGKLAPEVAARVERELNSIIRNGFAIMYYTAHHLVRQSQADGYPVGSRGSVGSSLVGMLCGITEVNPLPAHYRCPACRHSDFSSAGVYGSGFDLPEHDCPLCGARMIGDGQDIPFETFLGFEGDKQPDIDLNFSGFYQPRAHRQIEEMFGASHTFRSGTINGYAKINALALVDKYNDKMGRVVTRAECSRLASHLIGVKRTTGQHPGGIVVLPKEREIYDFTPIQYPADRNARGTITTHFDFNALHETILKLDVLGHDDPSMLKMLGDLTGVDIYAIPIPDPAVMSLFRSTQALGKGAAPSGCGTIGIPEMGTLMAREMIADTLPSRIYDVVQLMGLSHGTEVWKSNAQDLIRSGQCTLEEVIGCRDGIMTYLIGNGLPNKLSFEIMERVRKGRGLSAEQEEAMREAGVPGWYIDSCKKIRYLFPKAHAVAYTISSLRIAWFKINHPEAYYCAFFTIRADEFKAEEMCLPAAEIRKAKNRCLNEVKAQDDRKKPILYILELIEEMQWRGIDFLPHDLYRSDASRFLCEGPGQIRPPLNVLPQISSAVAEQICTSRDSGPFRTRDDLRERAGVGPAVIESLARYGCLDGIPETSQIRLDEWLNERTVEG